MRSILVIDDERTFTEMPNATYARTVKEAIAQLSACAWDEVFWDHDLGESGGGDSTLIVDWMDESWMEYLDARLKYTGASAGYPDARYRPMRVDRPFKIAHSFVHSMNPVGAARLMVALKPHSSVTRIVLPTTS